MQDQDYAKTMQRLEAERKWNNERAVDEIEARLEGRKLSEIEDQDSRDEASFFNSPPIPTHRSSSMRQNITHSNAAEMASSPVARWSDYLVSKVTGSESPSKKPQPPHQPPLHTHTYQPPIHVKKKTPTTSLHEPLVPVTMPAKRDTSASRGVPSSRAPDYNENKSPPLGFPESPSVEELQHELLHAKLTIASLEQEKESILERVNSTELVLGMEEETCHSVMRDKWLLISHTNTCLFLYLSVATLNIFSLAMERAYGSLHPTLVIVLESLINLVLFSEVLIAMFVQGRFYFRSFMNIFDFVVTMLCFFFFVLFLLDHTGHKVQTEVMLAETSLLALRYFCQLVRLLLIIRGLWPKSAFLAQHDIEFNPERSAARMGWSYSAAYTPTRKQKRSYRRRTRSTEKDNYDTGSEIDESGYATPGDYHLFMGEKRERVKSMTNVDNCSNDSNEHSLKRVGEWLH
eukprot:gb/GEZN01006554.1/.p1 GENE.gb/GEZN01006554.1/~~gb/GEZN01006554.1/.p1  ORF type:complete len:460 (+),score=56.18 gb/GEZN01006554.1/:88-1467(+)